MSDEQKTENQDELMLSIQGMSCSACATRIERSLRKLESIDQVAVSYPLRTVWIKGDRSLLDVNKVIAKIVSLGFQAQLYTSSIDEMKREKKLLQKRLFLAIVLTLPLLCSMLDHLPGIKPLTSSLPTWLFSPWLQLILATGVQFFVGLPFYISAYHAIRERLANMDVLVVLGTSAAYLYSHYEVMLSVLNGIVQQVSDDHPQLYFESSAVVITVVLIGKYIELSAAISQQEQHEPFAKLKVNHVMVERNQQLNEVHISEIKAKDLVHHQEGQILAIDGIIVQGEASIDEALLTGEQKPTYKTKGDMVWAGTQLVQGKIIIEAECSAKHTMLEKIRELVKQGQISKTNIQRQVDTVMRWFVPTILVIALITGICWIASGATASSAMLSILSVLLVACPCALGLAAPISLAVASGRLVKLGVIVKEASVIERLSLVKQIVFDKTGTLTEGKLSISFLQSFYKSKAKVLQLAAALEQAAKHPIAQAIIQEARTHGLDHHEINVEQGKHQLGFGVTGIIGKHRYVLGNERLIRLENKSFSPIVQEIAKQRLQLGETLCYLFEDQRCIGIIGLSDQLKSSTIQAMKALRTMNIELTMATGDEQVTARRIAEQIHITELHSNLLPAEKQALIEKKQREKLMIAMVGDGWNDAPALASAGIGIAMSNGTDAALHAGHMTILHQQLTSIPAAIQVSKLTVKNIKQNLAFALCYNVLMLPIAALGYLQPWMAGVAMSLSSLCVVFNALSLYRRLQKVEVD